MQSSPSAPVVSARLAAVTCAALVATGAVLRAVPCGNEFWLDEIWTYGLVRGLHSAGGVFTALHHSNNHHLSSLAFYWLGDSPNWAIYRLPSLAAGVASVVLAIAIAWRRGRAEALIAAVLFSFCFALVQFSSEARGYALAVFFALAAFLLLERGLARPRAWWTLGFGCCATLAFLSHLTGLFPLPGALAYAYARRRRSGDARRRALAACAGLAAIPSLAFAALYWIDLRHLLVEGGEAAQPGLLAVQTAGYTLGLPILPEHAAAWSLIAALPLALSLARLRRAGDPVWIFHLLTIAVVPAVVLLAFRPHVVALRYFLVGIAFYLLAVADGLAALARRRPWGPLAVAAFLALFVAGNASHIRAFLRYGRGSYLAALRLMVDPSSPRPVRIGGDHDFRNGTVLDFYRRYLPPRARFRYYAWKDWPRDGLDWLVYHGEQRRANAPAERVDRYGNVYVHAYHFEKAGVSGFYWDLYRATGEHRGSSP